MRTCNNCKGTGYITEERKCDECYGYGKIYTWEDEEELMPFEECPNCGGLGVDANLNICKPCCGTGSR